MFMKPALLALLLASATTAGAPTWHAGQGDVRATCVMTIGGSFDAKTTALNASLTAGTSSSPALDGNVVVDLRTLDTGISLRNEHLREKYLEVDKGPDYGQAVLSEIVLKGLNPDAPTGKGSFTASLTLHGVKKAVAGAVDAHPAGDGLRVKASFPVNLSDHNISEPRYLGVGVKNTVQIEAAFTVTQHAP
jgi:polyisoprenoid-binding protein YceI